MYFLTGRQLDVLYCDTKRIAIVNRQCTCYLHTFTTQLRLEHITLQTSICIRPACVTTESPYSHLWKDKSSCMTYYYILHKSI